MTRGLRRLGRVRYYKYRAMKMITRKGQLLLVRESKPTYIFARWRKGWFPEVSQLEYEKRTGRQGFIIGLRKG